MKSYEAIGVIETQYFAVAMEILDNVSKAADVEFLSSQNQLGGRLVSLVVGGGISDVTVAVDTARRVCEHKPNNPLKMALVITNPHEEILKYVASAEEKEAEETEQKELEKPEEVKKLAEPPKRRTRKAKANTTKQTSEEENKNE